MANKIIQLKDGSDNLYPASPNVVDISSQFTTGAGGGETTIYATYNPMTRIVSVSMALWNCTSNITTSTNLTTAPSGYRPSATINFPMMVYVNTGSGIWITSFGGINSSGQIRQGGSNLCRGCYFTASYQI